ncbi:uncharacterized, partial [Tachysurus ichikawai]
MVGFTSGTEENRADLQQVVGQQSVSS